MTQGRSRRPPQPPAFDDALEFMRMIWAIEHQLERLSKQMERRIGLTIAQRMCLLLIAATPGILPSQLADILHLHRGTVSGIVGRLTAAGLVGRVADARDARRAGLSLTHRGMALRRRRAGTFEDATRRTLAHATPRERAGAVRVLARRRQELGAGLGA
jgi:DNA-binding MarR family transcriptional regulator